MAAVDSVLNPFEPNPYEPARKLPLVRGELTFNRFSDLELTVERGWLYRRFSLRGRLETDIVWDARAAREFVQVNGVRVASHLAFLYAPSFEFKIPIADKSLAASIEVRLKLCLFVSAIRLQIEQHTLYEEGTLR